MIVLFSDYLGSYLTIDKYTLVINADTNLEK